MYVCIDEVWVCVCMYVYKVLAWWIEEFFMFSFIMDHHDFFSSALVDLPQLVYYKNQYILDVLTWQGKKQYKNNLH